MKGVTFGEYHSYNDLDLILNSKIIGAPAVKVRKVEIEGADGALDFTDAFGGAKYEDVTHIFNFSTIIPQNQFLTLYSRIKNALHGKKVRVILDDDPFFYYLGRLTVSNFENEKNIGIISIEADCEPWKYKLAKTKVSSAVSGTMTFSLVNSRRPAVPLVTITGGSLNIRYGDGNVWDLGAGSYTLPELELAEGENTVTVTGTGTISFEWQEAGL